jgi:hypothetical protein
MKCIVYNVLDPQEKFFYVNVNGDKKTGRVGEETDLTLAQIEHLEKGCIWEHFVGKDGKEDGFRQKEGRLVSDPRFRVIKTGKEENASISVVCSECGREFKNNAHLANHMRTHRKEELQPAVI